MCGITGFLSAAADGSIILRRMTTRLAHRGPDAEGFYENPPAQLGHRRLAVLDLETGRQPLFNEDGNIAVVFNGEIYNFAELRSVLQQRGHQFVTRSDTEVLVHGYEEYGDELLSRLRGMFAFAIWDQRRRRLLIARDHLGVKPLYYHWHDGLFAFASELKALLEHPRVSRELDTEALGLFLECQYIPAPRSIYRDIHKLPAGHALVVEAGAMRTFRYWRPDYSEKLTLSEPQAVELVERELRESVRLMLVADVPLGAFVSGGIDSSLIAALMTQEAGRPIDTFNLGFAGGVAESEHEYAQQVARHIGSRHHSLMLAPDDVLTAFSGWLNIFDEPFADSAALPTMMLAQFARQQVTVVLTGEGADEVFGGYGNYPRRLKTERLAAVLGHRWSPLPTLARCLPARLRKDRLLKAIVNPIERRYTTIPNVFDVALRPELYTAAFLARQQESMADYAEDYYAECNSASYLDRIMHVDLRLWLPDDLLTKVDRATMAYSLEARVPYLDHRFVEVCARLAPDLKCRGMTGKYLLKKLAERHLPHGIVHRGKQGFFMPMSQWLGRELRPLVYDCLGPQGLARRGILRPQALEQLLGQHYSERRNHAGRLWALLVLEQWFRCFAPDFSL
jgi:asparagine synthase (glutamine-hydrolysing)